MRIEDVDTPRCVSGMDDIILKQLAQCGLVAEGEVLYQSQRGQAYQFALEQLVNKGWAYPCGCSRKEIEEVWSKYGTFAQAIVTTEKDAVRLRNITVPDGIPIFVIPITVAFLGNESAFVQLLRST